jgi:hypothetical protein
VLLVLGAVAQGIIIRRLKKRYPAVPKPIQSLEEARTLEKLEKLIAAWGPEGCRLACRTLWWDQLFLIGYGGGLSLLCIAGADLMRGMDAAPAAGLWYLGAGVALIAAGCDVLENLLLARMLKPPLPPERKPRAMAAASQWKWRLVFASGTLAALSLLFDLFGGPR